MNVNLKVKIKANSTQFLILQTLFNYWGEIERYGIVKVTRKFGKTKLYTLNTENPITQKIIELEKELIAGAMNKALEMAIIN